MSSLHILVILYSWQDTQEYVRHFNENYWAFLLFMDGMGIVNSLLSANPSRNPHLHQNQGGRRHSAHK